MKQSDIPKELHPLIIKYLQNKDPDYLRNLRYDEKDGVFKFKYAFFEKRVKEKLVEEAYEYIIQLLQANEQMGLLEQKYADAVNYFHNDAEIDLKGIYIREGILRRKRYFTLYELDDLLKRYKSRE